MSNIVKKSFHIFMAVAIVIWTLSPLSILTTKTAQAAVSMYGSGGGSDPFYYIPPMGQVLPASSGYTGLFSFHLQKVSGDSITLSSVKVTLTSGGSGTLAANDIAGLAVFKRTSWDSGMYTFPGADNIGEIDNLSDGSGGNITIGANTIPVTSGAIPTNSFDAEYYVAVKTSSNWSGTDRVTYDVPTNWVTLSNSNTLGSACTTNPTYCQPDGDVYYATAPSDWSGTSFMVENVEYMGTMEDGTQEVEVRFTNDYDSGASAANNATNASNYNISGTNPNSVMQYGPMSVGLSFGSGVTINPNSTQLTIDKDIQDIMGNVLDDTSNIDFIITGAGSGGGASSPLYISEVSIGTANGGLEEFIEFYNPDSANALDFTAMPLYIWAATSSGSGSITHTNIASLTTGTVPANGYYLVAANTSQYSGLSPAADLTYDATQAGCDSTEGCLQANSGVYVSTSGSTQDMGVLDRLGWSAAPGEIVDGMAKCSSSDPESCTVANAATSLERKANPSSTASSMASGGVDETNGNSYMTYDNQYDFAQRSAIDPQNSSSTAETPGGTGFGNFNNPPYIFHDPLYTALDGNDLTIIGEFMDDSGTLSSSNIKLFWREYDSDTVTSGVQSGSWNSASGSQVSSGSSSYRFTISSTNLDANKDIEYFLRAQDSQYFTCLPGPCDATTNKIDTTQASPEYIDIVTGSGSGTISGTVVNESGTGISNVFVYTEGAPFTATTNSSGGFTLSGLPDGVYDVTAKGGSYTVGGATASYLDYTQHSIYITSANQTSSGNTLTLIQGAVESFSGTSEDQENPWVEWSAPHDGMMGFPKEESMIVVFDKAMQDSTIDNPAVSDSTANVYLMKNSDSSVVPGAVTYYGASDTSRPTGVPSASEDSYLLAYNPSSSLITGSDYTLVIKDTVLGSNGQRLMGNRSAGGHSMTFSVANDFSSDGDDYDTYSFGQGGSYPPYVTGTTPGGGAYDVALNTKINITFNESMASTSINTTNIKIYSVSNPGQSSETETALSSSQYTVTQNTGGDIVVIEPASNLSANTTYRVKVLSNCSSANGTPMSPGDNTEQFRLDFETGSTTDSGAPTVAGVYPDDQATGIPGNLPAVTIGFSEGMDSTTINTRTIKLKRGTSALASTVEYDVGSREARLMPSNALRPGAKYTLLVVSGSSGVKDIVGNALASDYESTFTTDSTIDTTSPGLEFVRCDDWSCSVTFDEPMKNARADDSTNYANSVLKPANYAISGNGSAFDNARATYDQMNTSVEIENIEGLTSGESFTLTVSNVQDKAGNSIDTGNNTFSGTVENSMGTGGMMGPGGPGPMMGPAMMKDADGYEFGEAGFSSTGGMTADMGGAMGFDFGGQWMEPVNASPMNMMAGATSQYMVEFKAESAIDSKGTIKITFPTGTDVSSVAAVPTNKSMANKDINGPMDNTTVTIASVAKNEVSRTVTVTTSGAISANDFVMFDLKGIVNPSVPKDFDTNGYTADIKTFNSSGALLQSETTMPYFINEAGDYTLSGTVTATGATGGTASIYLDSWQTGPVEADLSFSGGTATYEFTGLVEGDYHIRTEPSLSLTGGTYIGYMKPEPIWVSNSNSSECSSSTTCTKDITLQKEGSSTAHKLTVYLVGDFSGMDSDDRNIDIFAGGSSGETVKEITAPDSNCTGTSCSYNIYLPSAGEYWVGMGPAMPKGGMMMGPPPMPSWMPPSDVRVTVSGGYGSETWDETSGTDDDGKISFTISAASNQIIGYVVDSSGTAIANADVDAHRTQGGFGMPSHSQTNSNGKFTLKVGTGIYEVNAWMPGMPGSPGRVVEVQDDSGNSATDGNSTADVYKDNGTTLVLDAISGYDSSNPETELLIKMNKSSTTVSGKVLDNNGDPVSNAPVWAYSSTTGENRPSGTDSSGNYTIYVPDGDWNVEAHIPGLGDSSYANNPVTVSGSNRSDINVRPSSDTTFYTISGTVNIGGSGVSNASVWVDRAGYHNRANTDSSGGYRISVPANSGYTLNCWTPEYGDLEPVTVDASSGDVTQDFTVTSMNTLTINLSGQNNLESGTEAFIDVFDPSKHKGNHKYIDDITNVSSITMNIKDGTDYEIHMEIPGIGGVEPSGCDSDSDCTAGSSGEPDTWSITGDKTVTFDLDVLAGDLYTVTATVNTADATSTTISDAFVWLGSDNFHTGEPTNSSGIATIKVPAGTYKLGADKPGYTSPAPTSLTVSADDSQTISLTDNPYTLSGYIYADANSDGAYDSGEGISDAWVWGDKVTGSTDFSMAGGWTGTETDPDGYYELSISNGYWLVKATSDAYAKTTYKDSNGDRAAIQINGSSVSSKNIALNARSGYSATQPNSSPITPANGGTIDDSDNTGVKLSIPPSALGNDTSAGTVNLSKTYSVPSTGSVSPLGEKGYEISATDSSGQSVTSLNGAATVKVSYDEDDIPSGASENNLMLAYFDNSSSQWVEVPANIDSTNNTISGSTTHFSRYIVGSSADTGGPTAPSSVAGSVSGTTVTLSWTASTDAENSVAGYQILRCSGSGCTPSTTIGSTDPWSTGSYVSSSLNSGTSYTDSDLSAGTYVYRVVAFDDSDAGNHSDSADSSDVTVESSGGGGSVPVSFYSEDEDEDEDEDEEEEPEEETTTIAQFIQGLEETPISEMSSAEILSKIKELRNLLKNLGQDIGLKEDGEAKAFEGIPQEFSFEQALELGDRGEEVEYLQIALQAEVGQETVGPADGIFGPKTKRAVIAFQEKEAYKEDILGPWNLTSGTGYVGRTTRAKFNELLK